MMKKVDTSRGGSPNRGSRTVVPGIQARIHSNAPRVEVSYLDNYFKSPISHRNRALFLLEIPFKQMGRYSAWLEGCSWHNVQRLLLKLLLLCLWLWLLSFFVGFHIPDFQLRVSHLPTSIYGLIIVLPQIFQDKNGLFAGLDLLKICDLLGVATPLEFYVAFLYLLTACIVFDKASSQRSEFFKSLKNIFFLEGSALKSEVNLIGVGTTHMGSLPLPPNTSFGRDFTSIFKGILFMASLYPQRSLGCHSHTRWKW